MNIAHGAEPVTIGSAVGLVAAVTLATAIGNALPEFDARNPINYVAVILTIAGVTIAATYLPARRAASTDPVVALRQD
jgi:putative ABC transport system permease protein